MKTKQSNNSATIADAVKIANQRALFSLEWENDTVFKKRELNYKTKTAFQKDLDAGKISKYTTVFIKDTKEIYKNGQYYGVTNIPIIDLSDINIDGYTASSQIDGIYDKVLNYMNSNLPVYVKLKSSDFSINSIFNIGLNNLDKSLLLSSVITAEGAIDFVIYININKTSLVNINLINKLIIPSTEGLNIGGNGPEGGCMIGLISNGSGTKFLSDNGNYKEIQYIFDLSKLNSESGSIDSDVKNRLSLLGMKDSESKYILFSCNNNLYSGTVRFIAGTYSFNGQCNTMEIQDSKVEYLSINIDITQDSYNKSSSDFKYLKSGLGDKFLADNGEYKEISSPQTSIQDAPDNNYYVRKKGEWARINIPEVQQDIAFFDIDYFGYLPSDGYSKKLTSDQFEKIKQAVIDKKIIRINATCGTLFGFANTYYQDINTTKYIYVYIRSLEQQNLVANDDSKVDLSDFSVNISTTQNEDGTYTFTIRKSNYKIPEAPKDGRAYLRKDGKWVDPITNIIKIHQSEGIITGDINGLVIQWIRKNSHRVLAKNITNEGDLTPKMAYIELDDTNSNKYYDGTEAKTDGTEGDVFVKLPTFYYSGATLDGDDGTKGDILEIKFSKEYFDGCVEWNTNLLIGAYVFVGDGSQVIRSVSRNGGSGNIFDISGLHSLMTSGCGRQKSGFYGITWNVRSIINCLFYAMYGTTDFISKCGKGVSYAIDGQIGSGSSNTLGMKDTTPEDIVGKTSVNFWGFEDWCGNYCELFSDVLEYKKIDDTNHEITIHPTNIYINGFNQEMKFNINGSLVGDSIYYIKNMEINKYLNLLPTESQKAINGTFKSRIGIKQPDEDGQIFVYKGISGMSVRTNDDYQLFSFGSYKNNGSGEQYTTRLIFIGDCIRYQNSNTFKEIPLEI